MTFRVPTLALCLLGSIACSDPKPEVPGAAGTSSTGGSSAGTMSGSQAGNLGSGDSGGAAGEPSLPPCNDLELDAPTVNLTTDPDPAPAPTGGEIADGTYFATAEILYETASSLTFEFGSAKVVIAGASWQEASADVANPNRHTTSTLSTTGTTLDLTRTCPTAGVTESAEYSADGDGFTLYVEDGGETFATVFTRQ
jgi:hypothetical protein